MSYQTAKVAKVIAKTAKAVSLRNTANTSAFLCGKKINRKGRQGNRKDRKGCFSAEHCEYLCVSLR